MRKPLSSRPHRESVHLPCTRRDSATADFLQPLVARILAAAHNCSQMSQQGKVVVVTGSSKGGIGYSLCQEFARKGCRVYATARKLATLEGLEELGCILLTLDVASQDSIEACIQAVVKDAGKIDVLVNNAGIILKGSALDTPLEATKKLFDGEHYGRTAISI